MKQFVLSLSLAFFASGAALFCPPANADTIVEKRVEKDPDSGRQLDATGSSENTCS